MKVHIMTLIILVLVVGMVTITVFVPQKVGTDGKIRYFGDGPAPAPISPVEE